MREYLTERLIASMVIGVFGAMVHTSNHCLKARRAGKSQCGYLEIGSLSLTSMFSGMVFGLMALLISDNHLHLYLAVATGSFLGLSGLNKVTDVLITIIKK